MSIATTGTQARYVLPKIINRFHELYPKVDFELREGTVEQMGELAAGGDVDFVIASECQTLFPELNCLPCFRWDRIVLTRKDHPLVVANRDLSIADLVDYPLITHEFDANRNSSFLRAFEEMQLNPNVVHTAHDADVIKTYVRLGMGVGILAPMAVVESDLAEFHARSAKGMFPIVTTWIGIPRNQALQGYMFDFIELLAPHWPRDSIEQLALAPAQEDIDARASDIEIPAL